MIVARVFPGSCVRPIGLVLGTLLCLVQPDGPACAQVRGQDPLGPDPLPGLPELRLGREAGLTGLGSTLLVVGYSVGGDVGTVPVEGLPPGEVGWEIDSRTIGAVSRRADRISDWTRAGALAFPLALSFAQYTGGDRWRALGGSMVVYGETVLLSQGLTLLAKNVVGRARPYAYLSAADRPSGTDYDTSAGRTFRSMPSGHASAAWAGAALGMTEYLLNRPDAGWPRRMTVGFVGGALAGATSSLRVMAGQHFPSDVLAGAGIGTAVGVTLPLLHRGEGRAAPTARAWLEVAAGAVLGVSIGIVTAPHLR